MATVRAIEQINSEIRLSDADRSETIIELDQDTQGVLGSPPIAQTIFEKIDACDVFLADVTLVAKGKEDKRHINSNVAIELGYALGARGFGPVLKVMNTAFGAPNDLPFDLRDRRHPVQYDLADSTNKEQVEKTIVILAGKIKEILKLYLAQMPEDVVKASHEEVPHTYGRGRFWRDDEPLVPADGRYRTAPVTLTDRPLFYLRLIPMRPLPGLSSREALDFISMIPPLNSITGYSRSRNSWGAISYDRSHSGDELLGASQLFRNREIWAFDPYYAKIDTAETNLPYPIIPTGAIRREYPRIIDLLREASQELGYGDGYAVEFGLSGASGVHLAIDRRFSTPYPGPIFEDEVYVRMQVSTATPTSEIYNALLIKLFDEAGRRAPDEVLI